MCIAVNAVLVRKALQQVCYKMGIRRTHPDWMPSLKVRDLEQPPPATRRRLNEAASSNTNNRAPVVAEPPAETQLDEESQAVIEICDTQAP